MQQFELPIKKKRTPQPITRDLAIRMVKLALDGKTTFAAARELGISTDALYVRFYSMGTSYGRVAKMTGKTAEQIVDSLPRFAPKVKVQAALSTPADQRNLMRLQMILGKLYTLPEEAYTDLFVYLLKLNRECKNAV